MSTVVVIDEDGAMKTLICEWLEAAGYRLASTPSGNDAQVDLVVIDIPNPRHLGAQVVGEARSRYPHAAIVGMSAQLGQSLPENSALVAELGVRRMLAKPLGRDELLAATVDAIGRAS